MNIPTGYRVRGQKPLTLFSFVWRKRDSSLTTEYPFAKYFLFDSVINTGRSIMRIIDEIKKHNPGIDVIIAANVIQNEAVEFFKEYLVFATRLSKNSFVGVNQSKQTGKTGPDTADRLFNLIKVSKNSPSSTGGR